MLDSVLRGFRSVLAAKPSIFRPNQRITPLLRHSCSSLAATKMPEKTAGIVIIGDEILKGQTLDTNSQKICQRFYQLGFKVKRTVIIPDKVDVIARQVSDFSAAYDYVVTSGGVGPTHDDLTYDGVAKAFNLKLSRHPVLVQLLEKYFGSDHSHPAFKMSEVPETATILWNEQRKNSFPLVTVKNVYILPGIPFFMERCLECLYEALLPAAVPAPKTMLVYVDSDEVSITETLNMVVERYKHRVTFGSYPTVSNNYYKVLITLESEDHDEIRNAHSYLLSNLPKDSIVNYLPDPVTGAEQRLAKIVEQNECDEVSKTLLHHLKATVHFMEEVCLKNYSPDQVCISFNGGKDCTAVLHLYHCALRSRFPEWNKPLKALYIKCENPFNEVDEFIKETTQRYNLDLQIVQGSIIKGLGQFLTSNPEIKAIFMGNRLTDPHCKNLNNLEMTDKHWPQVMRAFPILNWTFADVWEFIRYFCIPYCILYDRGYTSLGSIHNTKPNPNLSYTHLSGMVRYHPAYKLQDVAQERNGRL